MLTTDDSFAAEQIAAGVPRKEAETGPQAHAITRWLGIDAPDHTPHTNSSTSRRPGWVLVCSDGLWNYCSEPSDLSALVQEQAPDGPQHRSRSRLAAALVDWANAAGRGRQHHCSARAHRPTEQMKEGTHDGNVLS